jgi:2'-5' RNA ligase
MLDVNIRRIFVSIPVPEKIKEGIFRIYEANGSVKKLIWTKEPNLHITVYFIGNVQQENFETVVDIVKGIMAEQEPFELKFEKLSVAPSSEKPRMVWLRFSRHELFTDLANRIHLSLQKFIPENPFHFLEPIPHITLARFNSTFKTDQLNLTLPVGIPSIQVNHCELWESIQTNEGARYISIAKFAMR